MPLGSVREKRGCSNKRKSVACSWEALKALKKEKGKGPKTENTKKYNVNASDFGVQLAYVKSNLE